MTAASHQLELLDADEHHALQVWPLDAANEVTLGRARTNVIVLSSPLVSRAHARLRYLADCWVVESLSELGVWSRGGQRSRLALEDGAVWSLGEHGPRLRLVAAQRRQLDAESTIRVRPSDLGILHLDTARRDREVAEIVASDLYQNLERRSGKPRRPGRGRIVSVHSFRGGTGKSNSTANLAALLARRGLRVCVIDTDIQSPGIHVLFGRSTGDFRYALNDFLWGRSTIGEAAIDVTAHAFGEEAPGELEGSLHLVPASLDAGDIARVLRDGYDPGVLGDGFRELLRVLDLDFLFIDTHPGVNEETLLSIAVSDLFLLLLRPDAQDLQGTAVTLELARRLGAEEIQVILNKVPPGADRGMLERQVEAAYRAPVVGVLPLSHDLARMGSVGLFVTRFPDHPWSRELAGIARRVSDGGAR